MRGPDLDELIARAYEAGADPTRWPAFLEGLRRALRAESCTLQLHDVRSLSGSIALACGVDPEAERAYNARYAAMNPWVERGRAPVQR